MLAPGELIRAGAAVAPDGTVEGYASLFGALSLLECPAFIITLLQALWSGHQAGIAGFAELSGLLIAYFGARFGVLGVYVSGRSREKQACTTGLPVPSIVNEVLKSVAGKR